MEVVFLLMRPCSSSNSNCGTGRFLLYAVYWPHHSYAYEGPVFSALITNLNARISNCDEDKDGIKLKTAGTTVRIARTRDHDEGILPT